MFLFLFSWLEAIKGWRRYSSCGRLSQSLRAATENARSPCRFILVGGTTKASEWYSLVTVWTGGRQCIPVPDHIIWRVLYVGSIISYWTRSSTGIANVDRIALVLCVHSYEYRSESWQPSSRLAVTAAEILLTHQKQSIAVIQATVDVTKAWIRFPAAFRVRQRLMSAMFMSCTTGA